MPSIAIRKILWLPYLPYPSEKWWLLLVTLCGAWFQQHAYAMQDILYLELVINDKKTGVVAEVNRRDDLWLVAPDTLRRAGINVDGQGKALIVLNQLVTEPIIYDAASQQLLARVDPGLLEAQTLLNHSAGIAANPATRHSGALLNYSLYQIWPDEGEQELSVWSEVLLFNPSVFLTSQGIYQRGADTVFSEKYTRLESTLHYENEALTLVASLGDIINQSPYWGQSIRLGGIRLARDFSLNPELITYPIPVLYGQSSLPSSLELLINQQQQHSLNVDPGPYAINMPPHLSGANTATLVFTDIHGRTSYHHVDFYASSSLLAPGLNDYDLSVGWRRKAFGQASNEYAGSPLLSGRWRHGVNHHWTPEGLVQAGEGLTLLGAGSSVQLGNYGIAEFSVSRSRYHRDEGMQYGVAYQYRRQGFSISARQLTRESGFRNVASLEDRELNRRERLLSLSYGDRDLGTFSAGYFQLLDARATTRELLTLNWNRAFPAGLVVQASVNQNPQNSRDTSVLLSFSMPLGVAGYGSASLTRDAARHYQQQYQVVRNAPFEGGLGWRLGATEGGQHHYQAALEWRHRYQDMRFGWYEYAGKSNYYLDAQGSLVFFDNHVHISRRIYDAFAVVDTAQHDKVPILLGHQPLGFSSASAPFLIPDIYSYSRNRIAIDPHQLPLNTAIVSTEAWVTPKRRGGVRLTFSLNTEKPAILRVQTREGKDLPPGTRLVNLNQTEHGIVDAVIVGWDGEIYIPHFVDSLTLYWEAGQCQVDVAPDTSGELLPHLGPFTCLPASAERIH